MHGDNIKNVRNFYMYLNNGAGGYIVYRKAGKGKYSKLANINKNTILSYTDKSAKNGTVYTYKIVACKTAGKTSYNAADSNQKTIMRITSSKVTKTTNKADGKLADKCTECGQIIDSRRIPHIKNIKLAYTSCTYDGTAKKPGVTVYDVDGNTLKKTDYTVSYKNNTASGAAGVTGTFKGNYAGRITAIFIIYPKAVSIKTAQSTAKGVKIIQYATAKTFKGAKTLNIAGAKNVSKTVKRLAKNKRYYVRVRSYRKSGRVTYYSAWSTTKNVVIKK